MRATADLFTKERYSHKDTKAILEFILTADQDTLIQFSTQISNCILDASRNKWIGLGKSIPDSVYYRLSPLFDHDTGSIYQSLKGNIELMVEDPDKIDEYFANALMYARRLLGFMNVFLIPRKDQNTETSVSMDLFLETLGYDYKNQTLNNINKVACRLEIINPQTFPTLEMFISVRTMVINALKEGATQITINIDTEQNPMTAEICDNASLERWSTYKEAVIDFYNSGIQNPDTKYDGCRGGGRIASFFAGQRFTMAYPQGNSEDSFVYFIRRRGTKGIGLKFPKEYPLVQTTSKETNKIQAES